MANQRIDEFADQMRAFSDDVELVGSIVPPTIRPLKLKEIKKPIPPHPYETHEEAKKSLGKKYTKELGDKLFEERKAEYEKELAKYEAKVKGQKARTEQHEKRKRRIMDEYNRQLAESQKNGAVFLHGETRDGVVVMTNAKNPGYSLQYYDPRNPKFHGEYTFYVKGKNKKWYAVPFMPNFDVMREGNRLLTFDEMRRTARELARQADDPRISEYERMSLIGRSAELQAEVDRQRKFAKKASKDLEKYLKSEEKNKKREEREASRKARERKKEELDGFEKEERFSKRARNRTHRRNRRVLRKAVSSARHAYLYPHAREMLAKKMWKRTWRFLKRLFRRRQRAKFQPRERVAQTASQNSGGREM